MDASLWILLPLIGAAIGYGTNYLAITMLFRPRVKRFGVQGLLPRRQSAIAKRIGEVVARDLIDFQSVQGALEGVEWRPVLTEMLNKVVDKKTEKLRSIPLIGNFLTPETLSGFRDTLIDELIDHKSEILEKLMGAADQHLDLAQLVTEKIEAMDLTKLEGMIKAVARRELAAIEWWGAILGGLIGLLQAVLVTLLNG